MIAPSAEFIRYDTPLAEICAQGKMEIEEDTFRTSGGPAPRRHPTRGLLDAGPLDRARESQRAGKASEGAHLH